MLDVLFGRGFSGGKCKGEVAISCVRRGGFFYFFVFLHQNHYKSFANHGQQKSQGSKSSKER